MFVGGDELHVLLVHHLDPALSRLFVFWILSCMSCLYILDINPLLVASFANIFSHSLGCLFLDGFLCCVKAFKFN